MCSQSLTKVRQSLPAPNGSRWEASVPYLKFLLLFIFSAALGILAGQSNRDEFNLLKQYNLPESAIEFGRLEQTGETYYLDTKPFSGLAFEHYPNTRLLRVLSLKDGLQHGPMYLWYPDGTPQMSANYRAGRLFGRFLGWYANGGIIYDMVINNGGYAGDYIEDDGARSSEESADSEGETTDND